MFQPWKGERWGEANNAIGGVKLLILGESHYCKPCDAHLVGQCDPLTTGYVVEELAIEGRHRFFTGLTQVVSGRPRWQLTLQELRAIWNSVVFYNYVPVFVATGPRVRPTREMFESGHAPFAALLKDLQPELVIVCGGDLWWWMRWGFLEEIGPPSTDKTCQIGSALAAHIMHPSANRFSSNQTRPTVESLFAQIISARPN